MREKGRTGVRICFGPGSITLEGDGKGGIMSVIALIKSLKGKRKKKKKPRLTSEGSLGREEDRVKNRAVLRRKGEGGNVGSWDKNWGEREKRSSIN